MFTKPTEENIFSGREIFLLKIITKYKVHREYPYDTVSFHGRIVGAKHFTYECDYLPLQEANTFKHTAHCNEWTPLQVFS